MSAAVMALLLVALLVIVVLAWAVAAHNGLVQARARVEGAWAQIDVQLKRRHSLIPNLIETVKGYASHERGTLEAVVAARNAAVLAARKDPAVEASLTAAVGRVLALAEAYPALRASGGFQRLQAELAATEDRIAYARQFHNSAVQAYNAKVASVPAVLVAKVAGFRPQPYFEADGPERADVGVRF